MDNDKPVTLSFTVLRVELPEGRLRTMHKNTLYELRVLHPTIDGVGYLKEQGSDQEWLVFIQVFLSKYARHYSKLTDLFTNKHSMKSMAVEMKYTKKKTLFGFYRSLANIHKHTPKNFSMHW